MRVKPLILDLVFVCAIALVFWILRSVVLSALDSSRMDTRYVDIVAAAGNGALVVVLLTTLGGWKASGLTSRIERQGLLSIAVLCGWSVATYRGVTIGDWAGVALAVSASALIAITEEALFRGLLLAIVKPRGVWLAVILTTLLDVAPHGIGATWWIGGANIFLSFARGLSFAAARVASGSLWPSVIGHGAFNCVYFLQGGTVGSAPTERLILGPWTLVAFAAFAIGWSMLVIGRRRWNVAGSELMQPRSECEP